MCENEQLHRNQALLIPCCTSLKVTFLNYCVILIKCVTRFDMVTTSNRDRNLWMGENNFDIFEKRGEGPRGVKGLLPGPLHPSEKVKFFIYYAIFMKFEIQHFHVFTNNNWDGNLSIGAPLSPGGGLPPSLESQILHLCFWWNLRPNIFIYLSIIIEMRDLWIETSLPPRGPFPPSPQEIDLIWCHFAEIWNPTITWVYQY